MSDQQEEEILRRRAREQAEIERQTDTLVLRTLTSLVTASEELKAKLRRDTEGLLDGYRRTKRQLDNEIALATSERLRARREAEQERAEIVREARAQAREIVEAAKREREQLLAEARALEQPAAATEEPVLDEPTPASSAEAAPQACHEEGADAPAAPSPVASLVSEPTTPAPAPNRPAHPLPFPARAYTQQPSPARRRPVELIFDGVPGYQHASALERAVNDVLSDEEIDILQFDRGQLVLGLQAADLARLAEQLVAGAPASLALDAVGGDRATFRCI